MTLGLSGHFVQLRTKNDQRTLSKREVLNKSYWGRTEKKRAGAYY